MQTIRRLYLYIVSFLSLEVFLWGLIALVRATLKSLPGQADKALLAQGLALSLAGLIFFLPHWLITQRAAVRDPEERSSRLRAFFLYAVSLAMLIPAIQNLLAILNRLAIQLLGDNPAFALLGSGQTVGDNLAAIAINLIAWNLFDRTLKKDWRLAQPKDALAEMNRLTRYLWLIYGMGLTVAGAYRIIDFVLKIPGNLKTISMGELAAGLALLVVGAPIWGLSWQILQLSLTQDEERCSTLRVVIFYLVTFTGAGITLVSGEIFMSHILRWLFGEPLSLALFLERAAPAFALLVPFGILWVIYTRHLKEQIKNETSPLRQVAALRIHLYLLAFFGNAAVFIGLRYLAATLAETLFGNLLFNGQLRVPLSIGLACLAVGLPLWLTCWLGLERDAKDATEQGDHARRSLLRKGYLYILLLVSAAGGMTTAGQILQQLFVRLLGTEEADFAVLLARRCFFLVLFLIWGFYHLAILRRDARLAHKALERLHARFPVLILKTDEEDDFPDLLAAALQRRAPRLPCTIHLLGADVFDQLGEMRACVLPLATALDPPNALRVWLRDFKGQKVIVPSGTDDVALVGDMRRSLHETVEDCAQAVYQLAEGQPVRTGGRFNAWLLLAYLLAGAVIFVLLAAGFSALFSQFG